MPPHTLYEVSATLIDDETARQWVRWILDEHIADVVAAGARVGRLIQLDDPPRTYVVQYEFLSRDSLDAYLRDHSPRLRAAGLRRFSATQVAYSRRTGTLLHSSG